MARRRHHGMEWRQRMFPLLAIPLTLGWLAARRLLGREYLHSALAQCGALAIVVTLVGANMLYRLGYSLQTAVHSTLALEAVLIALLWALGPKAKPWLKLSKRSDCLLALLSLLVVLYTNAQQIANPDDDYWIHAPLQGLMRAGNFPPFNPFFSDLPMNGHYGRNLSIVVFSYLSGADVFLAQHVLSSAIQLLTLWLFFSAFLRATGCRKTAFLGTVFVFFGINAGGRGGLIDTMQNNNPVVHLYLALMLDLVLDVWKRGSRAATALGGLALGSYAIVYETHFGLVFLTILGVTPILLARKLLDKRRALLSLLVLVLSLPLAFTQGGPLTDLLNRKLEGRTHTQAENLSKGMQNQAQVVKVKFPKDELFQILLETGEYQRIAHIYRMDTPLKRFYKPSVDRGYAYIWSWDVLRIHFLPLYLLPFSFVVLWRRGSMPGLFMGAFGTIAFLTPALVHFGPIYESEYYRWEFAAALGFTAALGLALASLLEPKEGESGPLWHFSASRFAITKSGRRTILVLLLTLLNSLASLSFVGGRMKAAVTGSPSEWLYFPRTDNWLMKHPVLDFDPVDIEAAEWLSKRVKPGDRLLTNFREENNFSILYESTLTGLTGARCVGHALPMEDEKIGTTPFRRSPAAVLFWRTLRPEPLRQLKVDWVFYRSDRGVEPSPLPGAKLVRRVSNGDQMRLIYKIDQSQLTEPEAYTNEEGIQPAVKAFAPETLPALRGGRLAQTVLKFEGTPGAKLRGHVVFSTVRKSDGLESPSSEDLRIDVNDVFPTEELLLQIPIVPPYEEGDYTLNVDWTPSEGGPEFEIPPGELTVRFSSFLDEIKIRSFKLEDLDLKTPWPTRTLLQPKIDLELPSDFPNPRDVLACWAFYSEEREAFDLLPGVNLRKVRIQEELNSLPMVTPERPGEYRLALYLSVRQGELMKVPVGKVTIR